MGRWPAFVTVAALLMMQAAPGRAQARIDLPPVTQGAGASVGPAADASEAAAQADAAGEFTTLKGHAGPVMALAVGPDGRLASGSFDNSLGLWQGRQARWLDGHSAAVTALAYAGDGRLVSGADDFEVRLWARDGSSEVLGRHAGKVAGIAAATDGALVATASWDGSIGLWPLAGAGSARFLRGHTQGVNAVAFSADGRRLYSGSVDGTLRVWDVATGQPRAVLVGGGFGINRLVLNEAAGWLAYGAVDGSTRLIDPEDGSEIADFTLERRPVLALALDPAGRHLAVGDGEGYIMLIDTDARRITRDFRAMRQGPVWALAFTADGQALWAAGLDDVVYRWPLALMTEVAPQGQPRSFLRAAETMPNGERQFVRKCSICHALTPGPSRKAGPSLHGVFGRRAGSLPGYRYSPRLAGSDIIWSESTIDALFDQGPDHYIPGSKMPMQVIAAPQDRADLIAYLKTAGD